MQQSTTHFAELEQMLLDPSVRRNPSKVRELLADDFLEFGSSGRIWTREATVAALAREQGDVSPATVSDLRVRMVAESAALVTYVATRQSVGERGERTLRSSIWCREGGAWRMVFHQGTVANSGGAAP